MRISFFTTGGTIDNYYPQGSRIRGMIIGPTTIHQILACGRMPYDPNRDVRALMQKDSLDMTDPDRKCIAAACVDKAHHEKILITHGTDTMIESAEVVEEFRVVHAPRRTVVFTGAMLPLCVVGTDAYFNIGLAIGVLRSEVTPGTYIAMNGQLFVWNDCVKHPSGVFTRKN